MNSLVEIPNVGAMALHEKVGEGGNGEVWFATHPHHGPVALKLVRPTRETEAGVAMLTERLFREAELTARVRHPNVVRVLEHGTTSEGVPYLVSERLDGADLGAALARHGLLPTRVAVAIVDRILAGLEAVHTAGIVHRDLKPDNLVLHVADGRTTLKLIDFGIASGPKLKGPKLTRSGTVVGTPHYLAPEQATGGVLDARADVYAVGVIFHELLTGRTPFHGLSLQEFVAALVLRDVPPVTSLRPGIPAPLVTLVHRALARNPSGRPSSARAFRTELAWAAANSGALGGDLEGLLTGMRHRTRTSKAGTDSARPTMPTHRPRPAALDAPDRAPLELPNHPPTETRHGPMDVLGNTPLEVLRLAPMGVRRHATEKLPGNTPMDLPGNGPMEVPGRAPIEVPRHAPVERPGKAPKEEPGRAPIEEPRRAPIEEPRRAPLEEPGRAPIEVPGRAPIEVPERAPIEEPGRAPEPMEVPGQEPMKDPMKASFSAQGTRAVTPLRRTRAIAREVDRPRHTTTTPILWNRRRAPRLDVEPVSVPPPWNGWIPRIPLVLLVLFVAALCIGSAEPTVMGELVSRVDAAPFGGAR